MSPTIAARAYGRAPFASLRAFRCLLRPVTTSLALALLGTIGCAHSRPRSPAVKTLFVAPPTSVGIEPAEHADWACLILREAIENEIRRGAVARTVREWSPEEAPPAVLSVTLTRCRWILNELPRDPVTGDSEYRSHDNEVNGIYVLWSPVSGEVLASGQIKYGSFRLQALPVSVRPDTAALRLSLASDLCGAARSCVIRLGMLDSAWW